MQGINKSEKKYFSIFSSARYGFMEHKEGNLKINDLRKGISTWIIIGSPNKE